MEEKIHKAMPWLGGAILVLALRGLGVLDPSHVVVPTPSQPPPAPVAWAAHAAPPPQPPPSPDRGDVAVGLARLNAQLDAVGDRVAELGDRIGRQLGELATAVSDLRQRVTAVEARQ